MSEKLRVKKKFFHGGLLRVLLWGWFVCLGLAGNEDSTRFHLSGLRLGSSSPTLDSDAGVLLGELTKRTHVDPTKKAWSWVSPDSLFKGAPFLWVFVGSNSTMDKEKALKIHRFISAGGTVMVEGSGVQRAGAIRQLREEVFSHSKGAIQVKKDDLLTRTFYLLRPEYSKALGTLRQAGRVVWIETQQPLLSGIARLGGAPREHRIRSAVNIVLYALTGSYKDDLTHRKYLRRRKR